MASVDPCMPPGSFSTSFSVENINRRKKGSVPREISENNIDKIVNKKYRTMFPLKKRKYLKRREYFLISVLNRSNSHKVTNFTTINSRIDAGRKTTKTGSSSYSTRVE